MIRVRERNSERGHRSKKCRLKGGRDAFLGAAEKSVETILGHFSSDWKALNIFQLPRERQLNEVEKNSP